MTIITWNTTRVAGGFEFRVYSFGYQIPTTILKTGRCATRAIAMGHAKKWTRYFKAKQQNGILAAVADMAAA